MSLFACIFVPKNLLKTLPERRPNPLKIDTKNVLLFNVGFFMFWHRSWTALGLQVGAKLAILAQKNYHSPPPSDLKLNVF